MAFRGIRRLLVLSLLGLQATHLTGVSAILVERQWVASDEWAESQCRCEGVTWPERHVDYADPVKVLPDGLTHIDIDEFIQLRQQFLERLHGHHFTDLGARVDQELDIASNDPSHPLRVLEDMGSADYGEFARTAHLMADAWGLRRSLAVQRGSFLSWMRVPGDLLMPCICPTGAVVAVSFRFPNEEFVDELRDPTSEQYITFTNNIREQVASALAKVEPAIVDLHVISLEAGSVVVNADVLMSTSMDKEAALSKVQAALNAASGQTSPPSLAGMEVDSAGFVYEVLECEESAPAPPANMERSVPSHRTTGTRATYTCSPGFEYPDGKASEVLTCDHVTRTWSNVTQLCERPRTTTTVSGERTTASTTTAAPPVTTEEPELDYLTVVTVPATAGLMTFFFLLIWCVSTKGPICSLITDKEKKKNSQIP
ncbi:uncharacterized protein LOC122379629 [Amphibalanus amphitrite]|uniref:uncharacterized protein LOC122379629 n=1 Tax=Amphibalanus amphitrite TaxID=1232801 RepID=UPI001C914B6A|nr:uncharacterized protein LOC122379629 [Amphibalanus amphitrite]